jgi:hypothetical protein
LLSLGTLIESTCWSSCGGLAFASRVACVESSTFGQHCSG